MHHPTPPPPQVLSPAFPLQSLLLSLPLSPTQVGREAGPSASGESNFPPSDFCVRRPGATEVGKHKIELGRTEKVDGAWAIQASFSFLLSSRGSQRFRKTEEGF